MDKNSVLCLKEAKKHMPLGVADSYRYWGDEETVFVESMQGYGFQDVDGKDYIDFRLAYGPIILGYRDQRIDRRVIETIQNKGSICGFSSPKESDVVQRIKRMCPQVEKLRFANSGTEGVLGSIRTARAFTGRDQIVVVEGGFHGLFDEMMWKSDVEHWDMNQNRDPDIVSFGKGLPQKSKELINLIPLNSVQKLEEIFKEKGHEIAAVIIEPIMGNCGSISATPEYMFQLRRVCDQWNSLLIMDEVKTGFRVAKGGAGALYDVRADLSIFAKAMGNGYPIAAFGGRADVMDMIHFGEDGVVHGGTYTANLIGIAAAEATLEIIETTDALKTVASTGEKIKTLLGQVFEAHHLDFTFSGHPSMFGVHFSKTAPIDYRTWKPTNSRLYARFAKHLIKQGIMLEPDSREPWFICEAHQDIDFSRLKEKANLALTLALEEESSPT